MSATPETAVETDGADNTLVISYMLVRQMLGYLGLALPLLLLAYAVFLPRGMQSSISHFYHTGMGDVLVGTLCAIGVFLFAYKGYEPTREQSASPRWRDRVQDRHVARAAGLGAVGVALFPVDAHLSTTCLAGPGQIIDPRACIQSGAAFHPNVFHFLSAFTFFGATAVFCFVLFPRGDGTQENRVKVNGQMVCRMAPTGRNRYFIVCGWFIVVAIAALALEYVLRLAGATRITDLFDTWRYFFWWEVVAVLAFAAAWLEKGRAIASPRQIVQGLNKRPGSSAKGG